MNDAPQPLDQIKKRVSAQMVLNGIARTEPAKCEELLDAIDEATSTLIIFDAETGEMVKTGPGSTGEIWQKIAAQCLPGMPAELVSQAYGDWLDADMNPQHFAVGSTVSHREAPTLIGKVTDRKEHEGELHTVLVEWQAGGGSAHYSPRELTQVKA